MLLAAVFQAAAHAVFLLGNRQAVLAELERYWAEEQAKRRAQKAEKCLKPLPFTRQAVHRSCHLGRPGALVRTLSEPALGAHGLSEEDERQEGASSCRPLLEEASLPFARQAAPCGRGRQPPCQGLCARPARCFSDPALRPPGLLQERDLAAARRRHLELGTLARGRKRTESSPCLAWTIIVPLTAWLVAGGAQAPHAPHPEL